MLTLYGIPNCNTVKKARDFLSAHGVAYVFYDFKKQGVDEALLQAWLKDVAWDELINRAGLTWRGLDAPTKASVTNHASAIALMQTKPSVIKRPVLVKSGRVVCLGFDEAVYQTAASA